MDKTEISGYLKPGKVFGPIYFVGTYPTSSHLIDTGEGLILVDIGYPATLWIVLENIKELGFDVKDIKIILISHGHYDHIGAAKELREITGAKIYVGAEDLKLVTGEDDPPLSSDWTDRHLHYLTPDVLIRDGDIIELGNISIKCLSTPGHTDGTMSFFFEVTDREKRFLAGMFGGGGTNTLTEEFLTRFKLPFENREKFLKSIDALSKYNVEIFLGNHAKDNRTDIKLERVRNGEADAFYAPDEWLSYLNERRERLSQVISEDKYGE